MTSPQNQKLSRLLNRRAILRTRDLGEVGLPRTALDGHWHQAATQCSVKFLRWLRHALLERLRLSGSGTGAGGDPFAAAAAGRVVAGRQFPSLGRHGRIEFHRNSGDTTSWVGCPVSRSNQAGITCRSPQRPSWGDSLATSTRTFDRPVDWIQRVAFTIPARTVPSSPGMPPWRLRVKASTPWAACPGIAVMNPPVLASGSKSGRCRSSNVALTVRMWRNCPSVAVRAGARRLG